MRIQSFLTAASVNLKRLAAAILALIFTIPVVRNVLAAHQPIGQPLSKAAI